MAAVDRAPGLAALTGGRRTAVDDSAPARFGPSEHACWGYASTAERARIATEWLVDGLALHQRAIYVADAPRSALPADLGGVPDRDGLVRTGALVTVPLTDLYDLGSPIEAEAQLRLYDEAVTRAEQDGFLGVRVAVDISALVAEPGRRAAHVRWEQAADRYLTERPLAPLCLYDAGCLTGLESILCSHPLHGPEPVDFALTSVGPRSAALTGEVDLDGHDALAGVLTGLPDSDRTLEVSDLAFMDVRGAGLLHDHLLARRDRGQQIRLRGASTTLRRIWTVCGFDDTFLDQL